jgi:GNAT superfamily N-acetyltransferase
VLNFHITTNPSDLDLPWVERTLMGNYWGAHLTPAMIRCAVAHSLCFGAYESETRKQIGFARVLTDRAVLSTLTDVVVERSKRRLGVGRAIMDAVVAHAEVKTTICVIATRYRREFYANFGFEIFTEGVMKRDPQ